MKNKSRKQEWGWVSALFFFTKSLFAPFHELYLGMRYRTLPWLYMSTSSLASIMMLSLQMDIYLWRLLKVEFLYPYSPFLYWFYSGLCVIFPFWMWGAYQVYKKRELLKKLGIVFVNADLKTRLGKLPGFISDQPLDECTRKLKLTSAGLPLKKFQLAQDDLESNLLIFIDEIRENRQTGLIEMIYAHEPMPEFEKLPSFTQFKNYSYCSGFNRSKMVKGSFKSQPHLLVAGQSGSGKSTFLRGLITTIYLNQKNCDFKLIDLKGGLEFQLFENLPRVEVIPNIKRTLPILRSVKKLLDSRMEFLRQANCKDLDAFFKRSDKDKEKANTKSQNLNRQIIVVDEAADLFLKNPETTAQEAQEARRVLSEIARKGRACGFHLVIGTQRPDVKSLDPQIKANLSSVLCFQMQNNASSITVLDNGRAADIAEIPGRAIWKVGNKMTELQTPFVDFDEAEEVLESYRLTITEKQENKSQKVVTENQLDSKKLSLSTKDELQ